MVACFWPEEQTQASYRGEEHQSRSRFGRRQYSKVGNLPKEDHCTEGYISLGIKKQCSLEIELGIKAVGSEDVTSLGSE